MCVLVAPGWRHRWTVGGTL